MEHQAKVLEEFRNREEARFPPRAEPTLANPYMEEGVHPIQKQKNVRRLAVGYLWADADDDEELSKRLDIQMSNPWLALDPNAVSPPSARRSRTAVIDTRQKPFIPFKQIPSSVKTTAFYAWFSKPDRTRREAPNKGYKLTNDGSFGTKNCHTSVTIDGGRHGCPVIRFQMQLSSDPSRKLSHAGMDDFHLKAELPCGPIQMARGLFRAYVDDKIVYDTAFKPKHERTLNDLGFDLLKRVGGRNATKEEIKKRMNGCYWGIGGGVVLEGFNTSIVQQIKANPGLYHSEAAQNIEAIEQLGTLGGTAQLMFAIGSNKEDDERNVEITFECLAHSVRNGHMFHYAYLAPDGKFTWNMPSISEVGNGFNVGPKDPGGTETFKQRPVDETIQNLQTFMITKACADLRELEFQVAGQNKLAVDEHRAYAVATSPSQMGDRTQRIGDEIYLVYVTLCTKNRDVNDFIPEPATVLTINWQSTTASMFEDLQKRWKGPVIHLPEDQLEGCHFVMFAHAKKDSVLQNAYSSLAEAKKAGSLPLRLSLDLKTSLSPRLKTAFKEMFRPEFRQFALMLMGRYDEAAKVPRDKYKILFPVKNPEFEGRTSEEEKAWNEWVIWVRHHNSPEGVTKWCLNAVQLNAISKLASPYFFNIVRGPPGVGKSLTAACAIWACLAASHGQHRILVVASSNEATDSIASKITQYRPEDSKLKAALIIRLHVEGAEYHHAQLHGDGDSHPLAERRSGEESIRVRRLKASFQIATLQDYTVEKMKELSAKAKEAHKRHIATYGLSLAEAVWKESALIYWAVTTVPEQHQEPGDMEALHWALAYRGAAARYRGGVVDGETAEIFHKAYQYLAKVVLTKASIIVTTCHNAASKRLVKWYKPDYLFVDESGQVTDTELIVAATSFKGLRQVILLGDPTQLRPIVTSNLRNEFSLARQLNLITRALNHLDSTHLLKQYRMSPAIAQPVSALFYQNTLQNATGLEVPSLVVRTMRRFVSDYFYRGRLGPEQTKEVLFVDLPNSKAWKDEHGESRINVPEANCVADITKALLNYDKSVITRGSVAIIAMYKSQAALIRRKLVDRIGSDEGSVEVIDISTVDAFQGKENKIMLLSFVLHGNDGQETRISNHLQDSHRLCVAISRARYGFILVGNHHGLKSSTDRSNPRNKIRRNLPIHQLLLHYENSRQLFHYPKNVYLDDNS